LLTDGEVDYPKKVIDLIK